MRARASQCPSSRRRASPCPSRERSASPFPDAATKPSSGMGDGSGKGPSPCHYSGSGKRARIALFPFHALVLGALLALRGERTLGQQVLGRAVEFQAQGWSSSLEPTTKPPGAQGTSILKPTTPTTTTTSSTTTSSTTTSSTTNPTTKTNLKAGPAAGGAPMRQRILAITATYPRAFQELHFTRLAATIRTVAPPFLWIIVESPFKTQETASVLERTAGLCLPLGKPGCRKLDYVHLETGMNETSTLNRGVVHRNRGLEYVEEGRLEGIVYVMDDDNTYSWQLFEEIRKVQRVGVLPVALMKFEDQRREGGWLHMVTERPLVHAVDASSGGGDKIRSVPAGKRRVYGWETCWWCMPRPGFTGRRFNVDMASFAFRSNLMWLPVKDPKGYPRKPVRFRGGPSGFLETGFLQSLVEDPVELEPLAADCTDILAWHVHMEQSKEYRYPKGWCIPQPTHLVPVNQEAEHSWPFLINDQRHGVKGRGAKWEPFVYS